MIYLIYLLSLVFILLLLYQLKFFSFKSLSRASIRVNPLEHEDLLSLMDKFNYAHDDGVCHGFTLTWAQEVALGFESQFYNRLSMIKREKTNLHDSMQVIVEKIKSNRSLSKKEKIRSEIRPFLEAICLAQSPEDYSDFYAKSIQQTKIDEIYKMIRLHLTKKKNAVKCLLSLSLGIASPEELIRFLKQCNHSLVIKNQAVIVFSSEEHTVGFKKHADDTWLFMDINQLYQHNYELPYQILSSEALAPQLYAALFEQSKQLVFHCSFIAQTGQRLLNLNLANLSAEYVLTPEQLKLSNCRGIGLLALAVQNDDLSLVRAILRMNRKLAVLSQDEFQYALFYAAACNRQAIMGLLLNTPGLDINMDCNRSGSVLAIASSHGYEEIVHLLLKKETIEVNKTNKQKETALMLASCSAATSNNKRLFELLLRAGADPYLTDNEGANSFALAEEYENEAALQALAPFKAKKNHQTKLALSAPSVIPVVAEKPNGLLSFLSHSFFKRQARACLSTTEQDKGVLEHFNV